MKKTKILLSTMAMLLIGSTLNADFLKVETGIGDWIQESEGKTTYNKGSLSGEDNIIKNTEDKFYFWVHIKHPIPVVPNLRVEYASTEYKGKVSGSLEDFSVPSGETSNSKLYMKQYDIIPYYNLLDSFNTTIDAGLDLKIIESDYTAEEIVVGGTTVFSGYKDKSTTLVPLGYVRGRFDIPTTGIGIEGDIKYITYAGNSISDIRIKMDYTLDLTGILDPGIEVGYRYQNFNLDDGDGLKSDITFSGIYVGATFKY